MRVNLSSLLVIAEKAASEHVATRLVSARRVAVNGVPMIKTEVELEVGDEISIGSGCLFEFTEEIAQKLPSVGD